MLKFLPNSSEIACTLFDLDGTLVKTHIDFARMRDEIRKLAESHGVRPEILDGKDILEMVEASAEVLTNSGTGFRQRAFSLLEQIEVEGCANPTEIDGATELLSFLTRAEIKTGVVTRNCRAVSVPLLEKFDLRYDVLLTRDDVSRTKPDPDHLHAAMKILSVSPHNTVMIGDHFLDIRAGVNAGCVATVGVLGDREPRWLDPAPPTSIVRDLREARPLFTA